MKIIRWDSYTFTTNFKDTWGTPINITGYTVILTIRKKDTLNEIVDTPLSWVVLQKINTVHSNPTQWQTQFEISSTETNIKNGEYYYDLQITYPDGKKSSTNIWLCAILQDVTKT